MDAWNRKLIPDLELAQVVVADDGSDDDTAQIAESWKSRLPITVVRLIRNKGKGAAVRAGVRNAKADLVLIYDADGAAPITEVTKLFTALESVQADIAIGSRVMGPHDALVTMSTHRRIIGRVYHWLCSGLVPGIRDTACGCKLFTHEVAEYLFSLQKIDRFAFDVEILAIAIAKEYRVIEVPLEWTAVPESKVRLIRDGLQMMGSLIGLYGRKILGKF